MEDGATKLADAARQSLALARRHGPPGLALGQKMTGEGAIEVAAEGAEVVRSDGRRVLDFGSYAVTLLGHRHPAVVQAVRRQLEELPTSTRTLANQQAPLLAAELAERVGGGRLPRVWLGLNGCDAVEAALKLARLATGRARVLALTGGFHGKSLGALAVTHDQRYRDGLEAVLVGTTHIEPDQDQLRRELARGDVAALIAEPVQGEGGVRSVAPGFLAAAGAYLRNAGAFLILDEIQTGLGRCGALSLGTASGVEPDALLLGKPLGGGVLPLSAALFSEELYAPLRKDPFVHTTTFSGHPLSAAAGLAALHAIEDLLPWGAELAAAVEQMLVGLARRHPDVIADVRGRGLLWGVECRSAAASGWVLTELGPNGLLVSPCMSDPSTIRLLPPLVTTRQQLERAEKILDVACSRAGLETRASGGYAP